MIFSKVYSAQPKLLVARPISIEVDILNGLHSFTIVGLGDKAVTESKDRVSSSIKNAGFKSPKQKNQKIVMSLAPAEVRKNGPTFDLPIAIAYLKAVEEISFDSEGKIFVGELSLDGKLQPMSGALSVAIHALKSGFKEIYVPHQNVEEASLISGIKVFGVKTLREIVNHLDRDKKFKLSPTIARQQEKPPEKMSDEFSMNHIVGQEKAKRALLIAAAGGHNIGLYGPPGTGKTLLAKSFVSILPDLSRRKLIECTSIHSIAGLNNGQLVTRPPFRAPHHSSTELAIIGGGTYLKPGEITLAHNGVLFLDEFTEFGNKTIESLRGPIESKKISIARTNERVIFPANFIFIAAMNPCPCGYFGTEIKKCSCSIAAINRYRKKISGPIKDRIDLWVEVGHIKHTEIVSGKSTKKHSELKSLKTAVTEARKIQEKRYSSDKLNSEIEHSEITRICKLTPRLRKILADAADNLLLSARGYHRTLKIARTIADLEKSAEIKEEHLLEALRYRPKD